MEIVDDAVVGTEVRRCTVDELDLQTFHTNQVKTTVTCTVSRQWSIEILTQKRGKKAPKGGLL